VHRTPHGELDLVARGHTRRELERLLRAGLARPVILDLAAVGQQGASELLLGQQELADVEEDLVVEVGGAGRGGGWWKGWKRWKRWKREEVEFFFFFFSSPFVESRCDSFELVFRSLY
jgi:hypothetical protein